MATVTGTTSSFTSASGSKSVTITPVIGELCVVFTFHSGNTAEVEPADNHPSASTYALIESRLQASSANRICLWIRNALWTSTTSTVVGHGPGVSTGGGLSAIRISDMTKVGSAAKARSGGVDNAGSGINPTLSWTGGGNSNSANLILAAFMNNTQGLNIAPPSGWTKLDELGYATPATGMNVAGINSGFTGASVTWVGSTTTVHGVLGVELDVSAVGVSLIAQARSINRFVHARTFSRVN